MSYAGRNSFWLLYVIFLRSVKIILKSNLMDLPQYLQILCEIILCGPQYYCTQHDCLHLSFEVHKH
jgi:hypothetical protein